MLKLNKTDEPIRVSVIIPAYNAGKFLSRALESLFAQTRPAQEIIVVDDGSTDNTAEVAQSYGARIKYIHQANAGLSGARNTGIKAACGNWIAFLDADDEWLPEHLQMQVDHLRRNPHLVWTTSNFWRYFYEQNRKVPDLDPEKAKNLLEGKEYFESFFQAYLHHAYGCVDTMLIKKEVLQEAGLFNVEQRVTEDIDMWFRIAYRHRQIGYLAAPLAVYYVDAPGSLIKTLKDAKYIRMLLDRHFKLADEYHRTEDFTPCAGKILGQWLGVLLNAGQGKEVRSLLGRYGYLYSTYFKVTMYISSWFPRAALFYENAKRRRHEK
jgi:glycosyltransferase involved in cell wall biosynthesis